MDPDPLSRRARPRPRASDLIDPWAAPSRSTCVRSAPTDPNDASLGLNARRDAY